MREFDLLQAIFAANARLPGRVTIPPGDDMGAVRLSGGGEVLVTVDQVADGVHFDLATSTLGRVGRKAITRNLSDVAAMAARPVAAVAAACLPRNFGAPRARELCEALRSTAAAYDCPLIGGDISIWDQRLIISVTILAEAWPGLPPLRRGTAHAGDVVFVSGELGGSLPSGRHLDFEPRLELARQLAANPGTRPSAMIDLSDGLARDLGHICELSGLHAQVEARMLPIAAAVRGPAHKREPWRHALGDGEDYELCFTIPPERAAQVPAEMAGVRLSRVGVMRPPEAGPLVGVKLDNGTVVDCGQSGWEHQG